MSCFVASSNPQPPFQLVCHVYEWMGRALWTCMLNGLTQSFENRRPLMYVRPVRKTYLLCIEGMIWCIASWPFDCMCRALSIERKCSCLDLTNAKPPDILIYRRSFQVRVTTWIWRMLNRSIYWSIEDLFLLLICTKGFIFAPFAGRIITRWYDTVTNNWSWRKTPHRPNNKRIIIRNFGLITDGRDNRRKKI